MRNGRLSLAKTDGPLDFVWSRPLPEGAEPSTVTVSRGLAGRWFVSILVEEKIAPLPPVERSTGVDAGLAALLTLSRGKQIANPRHERRARRRPAKARLKVARVHARIADRRRDHLHKVTTRLVSAGSAES